MVVPERPIHLDALLASAKVDEHRRCGQPLEKALSAQDDLPVEKAVGPDGAWVWKASQLLFCASSPPINVQMTRRVDVDVLAADRDHVFTSRRQTVKVGTGPFRNYDLRFPVQWQGEVTAYGIGEVGTVEGLLRTINSLGRLRRNGWGKIASLEVAPAAVETTDYWKRRALPLSFLPQTLTGHRLAYGTCRPPYWDRAKWDEVFEWVFE